MNNIATKNHLLVLSKHKTIHFMIVITNKCIVANRATQITKFKNVIKIYL